MKYKNGAKELLEDYTAEVAHGTMGSFQCWVIDPACAAAFWGQLPRFCGPIANNDVHGVLQEFLRNGHRLSTGAITKSA